MYNLCRAVRLATQLPLQNWTGRFVAKCVEDAPDWEARYIVVVATRQGGEVELTSELGSLKKGTSLSRLLYWLVRRCNVEGLLMEETLWRANLINAQQTANGCNKTGKTTEELDGPRPSRKELTGAIASLSRELAALQKFGFDFREFVFEQIDAAMVAGEFTPDNAAKWQKFSEQVGAANSYGVITMLAAETKHEELQQALREWLVSNSRELQRQLSANSVLRLTWQPNCEALKTYLASEEAQSESHPPPIAGRMDPSKYLLLAVDVAAASTRARHRHGAVLFVDLDLLRERLNQVLPDGIPEDLEAAITSMDWEDQVVATGCNTEMLTTGWKGASDMVAKTRWKVLHAEVVALCAAAADDDVRAIFFPEVTTEDATTIGGAAVGSPRFRHLVELLKKVKCGRIRRLAGCLRVTIAELHDNEVQFCASQACPLCIKGLKRWAVESQTYTTGTPELYRTEEVRWDPELVCESLQGAIRQFEMGISGTAGEPPLKKRRVVAPAALPNVLL